MSKKQLATPETQIVTMRLLDQVVGITVNVVRDILSPQHITWVPTAPREIAGVLNLRGRIVTAIDLRRRLNMPDAESRRGMSVVVEHQGELYSLMVDKVGDVLSPNKRTFDTDILALDPVWRWVAHGVYRMEEQLLVLLDVDKLLDLEFQPGGKVSS